MNVYKTLYHVTPSKNIESINERGIDPAFSEGKMLRSWFTDDTQLVWACLHCADRKACLTEDMTICVATIPEAASKRTAWAGVFTTKEIIVPTNFQNVKTILKDYEGWLVAIENEAIRALKR